MKSVGIVVPTLGLREEWLDRTVASIVNQVGVDLHVVLCSPGAHSVEKAAQKWGITHHVEHRSGLSIAVNSAMRQLTPVCDFVSWIGDDDLLAPLSLRRTAAALSNDARLVAVWGDVRIFDEHDRTTGYITCGQTLFDWSLVGRNHIPQPGSLYRADAWEQVGGLDSSLPHAMDLDLFWKMRKLGRVKQVHHEVAAYRWHASSISASKAVYTDNTEIARRYGRVAPMFRKLLEASRLGTPIGRLTSRLSGHHRRPQIPLIAGHPYTEHVGASL